MWGLVSDRLKILWDLPAPMKVKYFTRLLLKDKLALRGRLHRLSLVQEEVNVCGDDREESYYLFVHCSEVYRVWVRVTNMWEFNFMEAGNAGANFDVWCYAYSKGLREIIWKLAFVVLV